MQLWFLDDAPQKVWPETFADLPSRYDGVAEIIFASPFIHTVPGTDTYTDELW